MAVGWPIGLEMPPRIAQSGIGVHGHRAREDYLLPHWCVHLYEYACTVEAGEHRFIVRPGDLTVLPPGLPLRWHFSRGGRRHCYIHFSAGGGAARQLAALHRMPRRSLPALRELFAAVIAAGDGPRSSAGLWELLWRLAEAPHDGDDSPEAQAARLMAGDPGADRNVAALAAEVGLSCDHFTRRFKARYGSTPISWLRERRLALARELLTDGDLPIVEVAARCGIPDLHYFNKQVRARWGAAPRALRSARR